MSCLVVSIAREMLIRLLCLCDVRRRLLSNALQCIARWLLGPSLLDSAHEFSPIKCCSRKLKMKPRVVDYFGNLRRLFWKLTIS